MFSQVRVSRPVHAVLGVVLAGGLAFGATACTPSTTDMFYAASDGVRERLDSGVEVQNLMLLSNGNGASAVVAGALKNFSDEATAVQILSEEGDVELVFEIAGGELINFTENNEPTVFVDSLSARPGSNVTAVFQDLNGNSVELYIPVLDGTLSEYAELVPDN